jgi:hypothetical protein
MMMPSRNATVDARAMVRSVKRRMASPSQV